MLSFVAQSAKQARRVPDNTTENQDKHVTVEEPQTRSVSAKESKFFDDAQPVVVDSLEHSKIILLTKSVNGTWYVRRDIRLDIQSDFTQFNLEDPHTMDRFVCMSTINI